MASKYDKKKVLEKNPELADMLEDSERLHALKVVLDQEGGKMLVDSLLADIIGAVNRLAYESRTSTHVELLADCATLRANMDIVQVLHQAKSNEKEIDEILREKIISG